MSEIPDDVRKTADRLAVELFTGAVHEEDNKITMDMLVAVPMISRILLAEREMQRDWDARIAEYYQEHSHAARAIASSIRRKRL